MEEQIENKNEMINNQNTNKIEGKKEMNNTPQVTTVDVNDKIKRAKDAIKKINGRYEHIAEKVWELGKTLTEIKNSNDFKTACQKQKIKSTWNEFCEKILKCSRIYAFFVMNVYTVREKLREAGVIAEDRYVSDGLARILSKGAYKGKEVDIWQEATGGHSERIPSEKELKDACEKCRPSAEKEVDAHSDKAQRLEHILKNAEKISVDHHLTSDEIEDMVNKFRNALMSANSTTDSEEDGTEE